MVEKDKKSVLVYVLLFVFGGLFFSVGVISGLEISLSSPANNYVSSSNEINFSANILNPDLTTIRWLYLLIDGGINQATENPELNKLSYDNVVFDLANQDTNPRGIFFSSDGTKMYFIGSSTQTVYQYSLGTAWDLSTATYVIGRSVLGQDGIPENLFFSSDGTKMYMIGGNTDKVYQYNLGSAWNISSATYNGVSFGIGSQETSPTGLFFNPEGTRMYVMGYSFTNYGVYQYSLGTAWDLSTASYDVSASVFSQDLIPLGVFFKSDGKKMYMVGGDSDKIYQYSLTTEWNLSTMSYDESSFNVASQDSLPMDVFFKSDGTKVYVMGNSNRKIYQYSISNPPITFSASLSTGNHTWSIWAYDYNNNYYIGETRDIQIGQVTQTEDNETETTPTTPSTSTSSGGSSVGGSGSSSGATVYSFSSSQLSEGISRQLKIGDKINFEIENEKHTLNLNSISSNSASITVSSSPVTFTIGIGESKKIELSDDDFYDVFVELKNIANSRAEIMVKSIHEEVPKQEKNEEEIKDKPSYQGFIIVVVVIILLVFLSVITRTLKKRREDRGNNKI